MAQTALTVDGFDLATIGVIVETVTGRVADLRSTLGTVSVPGRIGQAVTSLTPPVDTRKLDIQFAVLGDTRSLMLDAVDELKWRLAPQVLHTLVWVDDTTREMYGYVTSIKDKAIHPDLTQRGTRIRVSVTCPDPREYATSDTTISSIGSSPVDMVLGAAPSIPVITVTGAGTFTITYKDSGAVTLKSLTITGATAPVVLDCDAGTVTDGGGNAIDTLGSTDDFPFAFDPQDGDPYAGTPDWPTLQTSAGTAEAVYRKAWW